LITGSQGDIWIRLFVPIVKVQSLGRRKFPSSFGGIVGSSAAETDGQNFLYRGMPSTNLKTSLENAAFFLRRSKIGAAKQTREQQFAKLPSSRFDELTELYNEHTPRHNNRAKLDKVAHLLVQILQVQEVQTIKEYTMNGYRFKVHVLEDTEL